jgi:hypothetical protein
MELIIGCGIVFIGIIAFIIQGFLLNIQHDRIRQTLALLVDVRPPTPVQWTKEQHEKMIGNIPGPAGWYKEYLEKIKQLTAENESLKHNFKVLVKSNNLLKIGCDCSAIKSGKLVLREDAPYPMGDPSEEFAKNIRVVNMMEAFEREKSSIIKRYETERAKMISQILSLSKDEEILSGMDDVDKSRIKNYLSFMPIFSNSLGNLLSLTENLPETDLMRKHVLRLVKYYEKISTVDENNPYKIKGGMQ